jgi:hypothetical protein
MVSVLRVKLYADDAAMLAFEAPFQALSLGR